MSPHLIYQIAIILFIFSLFMLEFMFILKLFRRRFPDTEKKDYYPIEKTLSNQTDEMGLTDIPETKYPTSTFKQENNQLRNIISELEKNENLNEEGDNLIYKFWKDNLLFLQSDLNVKKILLLKNDKSEKLTIARYISFSIEALKGVEENLNKKDSLLKKLIWKKKNLYFTGNITQVGVFQFLFVESERDKYNQIYLFPLVNQDKLSGVLFLIMEVDENSIPSHVLKELIACTNITESFDKEIS